MTLWPLTSQCGLGGLAHLIKLRFGDTFLDELFIVAPPFVILIFTADCVHFVSG